MLRCMSRLLALFGHGAMSDLSPRCAVKRTSAHPCLGKPDLSVVMNQGLMGPASFGRAFVFLSGHPIRIWFLCISIEIWRAKKLLDVRTTRLRCPQLHHSSARSVIAYSDHTARLTLPRPPHPAPNVRDDREAPVLSRRDDESIKLLLPNGEAEYFCARD
jgi:hypothetical protein